MEKLLYGLREGFGFQPHEGMNETLLHWINLANHGDELQRVSAFIVLLRMGTPLTVALDRGQE